MGMRLTKVKIGNTHDEDSDKEPEPPVKVIDKTPARTTKRNAPAEAPAAKAPADNRSARRGGYQGNEGGKFYISFYPLGFVFGGSS